jgi:hypothetical protein
MYYNYHNLLSFFDSPLHHAAGSQIQILHELEAKDEKILGCESGTQGDTSDGKSRI